MTEPELYLFFIAHNSLLTIIQDIEERISIIGLPLDYNTRIAIIDNLIDTLNIDKEQKEVFRIIQKEYFNLKNKLIALRKEFDKSKKIISNINSKGYLYNISKITSYKNNQGYSIDAIIYELDNILEILNYNYNRI